MNLKQLKTISKAGMYATAQRTLYLRVAPGGSKQWMQRLSIHGKRHNVGLGSAAVIPFAAAAKAAVMNLAAVYMGRNPIQERREAATLAAIPTFDALMAETFAALRSRWSSEKTANKWRGLLVNYAGPLMSKRVDTITADDVLSVLLPIYRSAPDSARRCRQNIRQVLATGEARGLITRNVAGDAITGALPTKAKAKRHHDAMPAAAAAGAYAAIAEQDNLPASLALRFLMLTAVRCSEATGATWAEIDMDAGEWTIPAERMKTRQAHRVPLSAQAMDLLRQAQGIGDGGELVFPSPYRQGGECSREVLIKMLRASTDAPCTLHGLRGTFRTWCADSNVKRETAELALAHTVAGVEGAYQHSDMLEARRAVMSRWAGFVTQTRAKVTRIAA